ncbi:MAG: GTPase HflX, partial [Bacteroidales bacterium]
MEKLNETAVFVAIVMQQDDETQVVEYLDELQFLAETAGVTGSKRFLQRLEKPNSRTYIGSGKLQEITTYVTEHEIDYVI